MPRTPACPRPTTPTRRHSSACLKEEARPGWGCRVSRCWDPGAVPCRWGAGLLWVLALGVLLVCSTAHAQPEASSGVAEALFREAIAYAKAGRYEAAIAKFAASYELDPARGTLLGWAMAEERAGRLAAALGRYRQLQDLARIAGDEPRRSAAEQGIEALLPRVPTLKVASASALPPNTELRLDGQRLPLGAVGSELPLEPGVHEVYATSAGQTDFLQRITLVEGARRTVIVRLAPPLAERPPPSSPQHRLTVRQKVAIAVGSLGVATMGIGTYFLAKRNATYREVYRACGGYECETDQTASIEEGRHQQTVSNAAFALGGVGVAAGVGLLAVDFVPRLTGLRANVTVTPAAITLSGRF